MTMATRPGALLSGAPEVLALIHAVGRGLLHTPDQMRFYLWMLLVCAVSLSSCDLLIENAAWH